MEHLVTSANSTAPTGLKACMGGGGCRRRTRDYILLTFSSRMDLVNTFGGEQIVDKYLLERNLVFRTEAEAKARFEELMEVGE